MLFPMNDDVWNYHCHYYGSCVSFVTVSNCFSKLIIRELFGICKNAGRTMKGRCKQFF